MRILHVTDAYLPRLGGIELHVHDLARAQAAAGDQVDIITMTRGWGTPDAPRSVMVIRPGDDAGILTKSRYLAHHRSSDFGNGYDVIHAHCSTVSLLSFFGFSNLSVPRLLTAHSLWRRYTPVYRAFDHALHWSS